MKLPPKLRAKATPSVSRAGQGELPLAKRDDESRNVTSGHDSGQKVTARLDFVLPFPPSPNHWLIPVRVGNALRLVPSAESKAYKRGVRETNAGVEPLKGPVAITRLRAFPPVNNRDLDNVFKVLLDALKGVAWADDRQVKRIDGVEMLRADGAPRVELTVEELGDTWEL